MAIKRSSIENLKSRVNIVELAGRVTALTKRGHSYVGLSPFVSEKTPSFFVEPDKNVFYCFASNQGGDAITFVQMTEHLDFYEAVETIAERFNIALEYEEGTQKGGMNRSLKKELLEIHLYATEYYQRAFKADHPEADAAREYWLENRKFSMELADEFQVGYAPAATNKLWDMLVRKQFSSEALASCGLFFISQRNPNAPGRARFRGRLMIPLRDNQGQIIGFTGRKMDATPQDDPAFEAKYVNSPETPLFKKSQMLFNFDRARKAVDEQKFFLMVEGQLDALRAWSVGLEATVAPQGTAATQEQLSLLKRYDSRLRVFLDGDRAGQAAALRILPMALAEELDILFLKLPEGEDPDIYLQKNPTNPLGGLESLSAISFALQALYPAEASAQAKADALHKILEIIKSSNNAIVQEAMLDELIRAAYLNPKSVRTEFEKLGKNSNYRPPNDLEEKKNFNKNLTSAELELLWLLVWHPEYGAQIAAILPDEWLDLTSSYGKLLNVLLAESSEGGWDGVNSVDSLPISQEQRSELLGLAARALPHSDPVVMANNALKAIFNRFITQQRQTLKQTLKTTQDPAQQLELLKKQQNLLHLAKKIPSLSHEQKRSSH